MIELLCEAIKRECDNVIKSTQDLDRILKTPVFKDKAEMVDDIRIDAVLHIQKLTEALVGEFYVKEGDGNERSSGAN